MREPETLFELLVTRRWRDGGKSFNNFFIEGWKRGCWQLCLNNISFSSHIPQIKCPLRVPSWEAKGVWSPLPFTEVISEVPSIEPSHDKERIRFMGIFPVEATQFIMMWKIWGAYHLLDTISSWDSLWITLTSWVFSNTEKPKAIWKRNSVSFPEWLRIELSASCHLAHRAGTSSLHLNISSWLCVLGPFSCYSPPPEWLRCWLISGDLGVLECVTGEDRVDFSLLHENMTLLFAGLLCNMITMTVHFKLYFRRKLRNSWNGALYHICRGN